MFRLFFRRKKPSQENVANKGKPSPSQQSVPGPPAAAATQSSAPPPKAEEPKKTKKKWKTRLFSCFQKKDCNSTAETSETTAPESTKKRSWWPFKFCKRKSQVTPVSISEKANQTEPENDDANSRLNAAFHVDTEHQTGADPQLAAHSLNSAVMDYIEEILCTDNNESNLTQLVNILRENMKDDYSLYAHILELIDKQLQWDDMAASRKAATSESEKVTDGKFQTANHFGRKAASLESEKVTDSKFQTGIHFGRKAATSESEKVTDSKLKTAIRFGFPNIGNSCYMNSCLQSILSLEDFTKDISCQEHLWNSVPEAQLLRRLINIRDCRESNDYALKINRLCSFKKAFATYAPQYKDNQEKDAHEFLTLLLNQIQMMSTDLQKNAALLGQSYTCPVESHFTFQMENMRTCKSCGAQTSHLEDFTSLSLDLVVDGSVLDMLVAHLKDKELEFKCECGGTTSGLKSSFDTLPRVLILHFKRFSLAPTHELEKLHDPIRLQRDVLISSNQGGGCYSLVSVISHYGNIKTGHYISHSIHPDYSPDDPTDRWLTFNDRKVFETTGSTICEEQKHLAYILFYKRQV